MKIRILTESEKGLGLGHVARCYNLARVFVSMGYNVDFFVRGNATFKDFIATQGRIEGKEAACYPLALQWEEIENPSLLHSDICIIDSYQICDFTPFLESSNVLVIFDDDGRHFEFLKRIVREKNSTKAKLFLLNLNGFYNTQTIDSEIKGYIFSGLKYALLHPFLYSLDITNSKRESEFFVCLGGEDSKDISSEIFTQLLSFAKSIVMVVGPNYKGSLLKSKYLCDNIDSMNPYRIYSNITQAEVATLLAQAKHCIVSGGGILFEALKLCPKVFAINLATNQDIQISTLEKQNLIRTITLPLQSTIFESLDSISTLKPEIGTHTKDFVTELIFNALNHTLKAKQEIKAKNFQLDGCSAFDFCNLSHKDSMNILTYRNHPFVRERMYGSSVISEQSHINFLQSLPYDEHAKYFLVKDTESLQTIDGNTTHDIGVISFSRINLKHKNAYLGIYKNPFLAKHKTKRYGHILMQMIRHIAFCHYNLYMLYLEVVATNTHALNFYEKEGFSYLGTLANGFRIYENNIETFHHVLLYGMKNPHLE
ncbi:UDP-4-amino-4,6-dideoxy-N-acetyl-beta-L-altrosamine N-acetyltransferase [Helicobacter bilis]|uniref:UDP-4-amino-4, 6-dideoxy-N-acetyl-beta-L-altrosamine N-acetyltransferase n=1 Tax=Helicobacter bilis TaxID=37372 RepID=UPI000CF05B7E|nr:UDP-4-amino-4,6-dideoxy-N-acetyl-beta-L-altrosamine N-acetyltransferase [Helicobacter bilis]